jgi:ATP-dependent protease ClpP protease subunit
MTPEQAKAYGIIDDIIQAPVKATQPMAKEKAS